MTGSCGKTDTADKSVSEENSSVEQTEGMIMRVNNATGYRDYRLQDMVSGPDVVREERIADCFPELTAYIQKIRIFTDGNVRVQVRDLRGKRTRVYTGRMKSLTDASWQIGDSEMYFSDGCLYLAAGNQLCMGRDVEREATE